MKLIETDMASQSEEQSVLRVMTCEQAILSRADGSACFNQGDTSALAAVYGPGDVKISKEMLDRATVEVIFKPKVGLPGCAEKQQERFIRNTCETVILSMLHPRTSISIVVQEMQNSGSLLACCLNSACLALLDAGIPMRYMVSAVSCVIDSDGQCVLDPTLKQEQEAKSHYLFAFDSKDFNVVTTTAKGTYTEQQYQECLLMCREAAKEIVQFYRKTLEKKLSRLS